MQIITPQQRLSLIPFSPTKTSSDLGWSSIRVEDYRFLPPSDLSLGPMDHHIIAFHYKPPHGQLVHSCGSESSEAVMQNKDVTYVPAKVDNKWRFDDDGAHCLHILLDNCFMARTALTACNFDPAYLQFRGSFQSRDSQLPRFAELFYTEFSNGGQNGPLYAESLATALAVYLLNSFASVSVDGRASSRHLGKEDLRRTLALIHERYAENLSLQEMADNVALSPYHFARLFRNSMGCPPHQYVIRLRLDAARDLLSTQPDTPISTIAHQLGFSDHTHLSRQFRARFAVTPSAYRAGCL